MKLYFLSIVPIIMSLLLVYLFPLNSLLPLIIFWFFLSYLFLRTVFRGEIQVIMDYRKGSKWGIFSSYLVVHYLVYSIAIIELLTYIYRPINVSSQPAFISVFSTPFGNTPNFANLGLSLLFNPTITAFIPPNIVIELSLYSIAMGLYIAILVTSSLIMIISINKKLKYFAFIPLIGIIAGASCCVSIPVLLAESLELSNIVLLSATAWQAVFVAYVSLPILTVVFLKHLSSSLLKVRSKIIR